MEDLHRNLLLAFVKLLQLGVVDSDVLLDVLARKSDLLIPPRAVDAVECPVGNGSDGSKKNDTEEVGFEATVLHDWDEGLEDVGHDDDESTKMDVVEGTIPLVKANERRIFDSGVAGHPH